jgi:hypothetical protein
MASISPGNDSGLFVAELRGQSALEEALAKDRQPMWRKSMDIYRIVR